MKIEAAKKGVKAPLVKVVCESCGKEFERSAYHPYVKRCQDCRKVRVQKVVGKQELTRIKTICGVTLLENLSTGLHYGLEVDGKVTADRLEREDALAEFRRLSTARLDADIARKFADAARATVDGAMQKAMNKGGK